MEALIQVFRMSEVSVSVRASIIKKLGRAINDQYAMNITEELVEELVKELTKRAEILENTNIPF